MSNKCYNLKEAFLQTNEQFISAGLWYDNALSIDNLDFRTISPSYLDLNTHIPQIIWNADMTDTIYISVPSLPTPRDSTTIDKYNEWAQSIAIEHGFDTFGYQAGYAIFFGKYGMKASNTNITYKFDSMNQPDDFPTNSFGGPWINEVYILSSLLPSTKLAIEIPSTIVFQDKGCWIDRNDGTNHINDLTRTIFPSYIDITKPNQPQRIYNSLGSDNLYIVYPDNLYTQSAIIAWAQKVAIQNGFDTFGFQVANFEQNSNSLLFF
jgi:hypothetical protein